MKSGASTSVIVESSLMRTCRLGAGHDPGMLAELRADLFDDRAAGAADRADRERREEVHQHRAEEPAEEDVDLREVDDVEVGGSYPRGLAQVGDLVEVRGEQQE